MTQLARLTSSIFCSNSGNHVGWPMNELSATLLDFVFCKLHESEGCGHAIAVPLCLSILPSEGNA